MATVNLNNRTGGGTSTEERVILPTDTYRMKCLEAKIEDDTFSKPNKDGSMPQKIVTVWEVTQLTDEQQEAAEEAGQDWSKVRMWHRFNPYYGPVKAGGPSKLKEFIDSLIAQGHLGDFNVETFDPETFVGIEQRCAVVQYTKTMGENAGQPGNKITGFAAVRTSKKDKNRPQPVSVPTAVEEDALPF
jgi:hypothetical protein